jgi:tetratricopeptide (TPR) repeat protein
MRVARERAPGSAPVTHHLAATLWVRGRFPEALDEARRGAALDPRNAQAVARLGRLEMWLRDYPAAGRDLGRALALDRAAPAREPIGDTMWVAVANGDTAAARAALGPLRRDRLEEVVVWALRDLWIGWALGSDQRRLALEALKAQGAPGEQVMLAVAQDHWLAGRTASARAAADSAARLVVERMQAAPREPAFWTRYVLALSLGSHPETMAVRLDSARAVAGVNVNHFEGAFWGIALAEAAAVVGEREQALALIRELLAAPGLLTPAWLRLDPYFASLRQDPEFRKLAGL